MHILLPGAWPEPEVASELADHLEQYAPTLMQWLRHVRPAPQPVACPAAETWCTADEHWRLQACGYVPDPNRHISAGLGPLRLPDAPQGPVWLAELIHMAPSRDGAALLPARTLHITAEQSQALYESACLELQDHPDITLTATGTDTWQVHWAQPVDLPCASPALVAASAVNDWWPQAPQARPWRKLVNALQMTWFEHPVNLERAQQGLPPVNSLWLYGGAPAQAVAGALPQDLIEDYRLLDFALRQDWGGWLQAWQALDQELLAPRGQARGALTLTGRERHITLNLRPGWLSRFRPHPWRRWWTSR